VAARHHVTGRDGHERIDLLLQDRGERLDDVVVTPASIASMMSSRTLRAVPMRMDVLAVVRRAAPARARCRHVRHVPSVMTT
jgi:hypothetical protein